MLQNISGWYHNLFILQKHPEGVAQIMFKEFEAAEACVQLLNNRWFCQRQLTVEIWDGKTKYKYVNPVKTLSLHW